MKGWKTPQAVLFDCDGVLVDSEVITNRLLRDDMAGRGLDLTLDQINATLVGGTMEAIAEKAVQMGADLPADWVTLFYEKMFTGLAAEVGPVAGVAGLLEALEQAGVDCAVASNGPRAKMEITLNRTGLMGYLSPHIYSARDLEHPKPAPDIYLHAAAQLGVAVQDCVVVEDSGSGAQAARAAGMRCIGYAVAGQGATLARYCDVVLDDMASVQRQLGL